MQVNPKLVPVIIRLPFRTGVAFVGSTELTTAAFTSEYVKLVLLSIGDVRLL